MHAIQSPGSCLNIYHLEVFHSFFHTIFIFRSASQFIESIGCLLNSVDFSKMHNFQVYADWHESIISICRECRQTKKFPSGVSLPTVIWRNWKTEFEAEYRTKKITKLLGGKQMGNQYKVVFQ